jgi:hypothetical protein
LLTHVLIQVVAFYISNFLFRPMRVFRIDPKSFYKKYESRAEITLAEITKRNTEWQIRKKESSN